MPAKNNLKYENKDNYSDKLEQDSFINNSKSKNQNDISNKIRKIFPLK